MDDIVVDWLRKLECFCSKQQLLVAYVEQLRFGRSSVTVKAYGRQQAVKRKS